MTTTHPDSREIGAALLRSVAEGAGEGKHGRITQIFPYIHEASKKMGLRAISRWLEERGMPISHATISRSLRSPEPHWKGYFYACVRPHAVQLSNAWDIPARDFLFLDSFSFESLALDRELSNNAKPVFDTLASIKALREGWFMLANETRANCRPYAVEEAQ